MKLKLVSLLLCVMLVTLIFSGCGASKQEEATSDEATTVTQNEATKDTAQNDQKDANKPKEKKKIAVVLESNTPVYTAKFDATMAALEKGGYTKDTADITVIKLETDEKKSEDAVKQVKDLKPDIAIVSVGSFAVRTVGKALEGSGIPVIVDIDAGNPTYGFIDENGKPKQNVTGIYMTPKDLQVNAFDLLKKIAPPNGKKAVFITTEGFYKKEAVEQNLKTVGVELKDYCESKYVEDWQAAVKKYNADNEVGWMLIGVAATMKKDGTTQTVPETLKWDFANRKKPTVTYWESVCQKGALCALGVDLVAVGTQAGDMAVKILNGEQIQNINAEYPRKTSIIVNQKNAKDLGLTIPPEILGSAKVYNETIY